MQAVVGASCSGHTPAHVCAFVWLCGCVAVCVGVCVRDPQLKGARTAAAAASMRMTAKAAQLSAQVTTLQAEHDALEAAKARLADKLREEQRRCAAAEAEVSSLRDAAAASDRVDKAAAGSRTAAASAADEVADLKRQLQQAQEALRASNEATAAVQHRHERALRLAAQQRDRAVQDAEASEKRAQKAKEEVRCCVETVEACRGLLTGGAGGAECSDPKAACPVPGPAQGAVCSCHRVGTTACRVGSQRRAGA